MGICLQLWPAFLDYPINALPACVFFSAAYGQFMGMASISWNAVWTFDFLCVLANPLRRYVEENI